MSLETDTAAYEGLLSTCADLGTVLSAYEDELEKIALPNLLGLAAHGAGRAVGGVEALGHMGASALQSVRGMGGRGLEAAQGAARRGSQVMRSEFQAGREASTGVRHYTAPPPPPTFKLPVEGPVPATLQPAQQAARPGALAPSTPPAASPRPAAKPQAAAQAATAAPPPTPPPALGSLPQPNGPVAHPGGFYGPAQEGQTLSTLRSRAQQAASWYGGLTTAQKAMLMGGAGVAGVGAGELAGGHR